LNVWGSVRLLDVDGDGMKEFLHYNGHRLMRVYRQNGRRLWQIQDPRGYTHSSNHTYMQHYASWDLDGDGRDEVIHCWGGSDDRQRLQIRNGLSGIVLAQVRLPRAPVGGNGCSAIVLPASDGSTNILVPQAGSSTAPGTNNSEYFARAEMYRVRAAPWSVTLRWARNTDRAGHWAYPSDVDGDNLYETVFVGKYKLDVLTGNLLCTLQLNPSQGNSDHVDDMAVGDILPQITGREVVIAAESGGKIFRERNCALVYAFPRRVLTNPDQVSLGDYDVASPGLEMVFRARNPTNADQHRIQFFRSDGTEVRKCAARSEQEGIPTCPYNIPGPNINVDNRGPDDLYMTPNVIADFNTNRVRLSNAWHFGLIDAPEETVPYDIWHIRWIAYDIVGDSKEEMIVWGRDRIVVGGIN
jgi:hypothetical protein